MKLDLRLINKLIQKATMPIFFILFFCINTVFANVTSVEGLRSRDSFIAVLDYVLDGDSVFIKKNGTLIPIRLWGIDAPEFDQPFSSESKKRLQALTYDKRLTIIPKDIDKFGRLVAIMEADTIIVNSQLVEEGMAWVHVYYCDSDPCSTWYELEKRARMTKKGLWQNVEPIEPWVWKRKK